MTTVLDYILSQPVEAQERIFAGLNDEERAALAAQMDSLLEYPLYRYRNDHLGFVTKGLGEGTWSGQDEILKAVDEHRKVAVVATHNIGKSHISARVVLGTGCTWPEGLARVTTTATNYRQVTNILWPYIRRTHKQYQLPGMLPPSAPAWRIGDELVADGFSAAASDETAVQGMHANGEFLLVVDEAGGISDILGQAFNSLLTQDNAHALVIGNAPTERENSWFQRICESGDWHVITIPAFRTPAYTGEVTGLCTTCPPSIEQHRVSKHLTSPKWVSEIRDEFGEDSPYYIARVLAQFPKNVKTKTLPMAWLEASRITEEEWTNEKAKLKPARVSLGVDVASGGGDELAIAWKVGMTSWVAASAAGAEVSSPHRAARFILEQIELAELYQAEHGIVEPVRVKIDAIGIGWGVAGTLEEFKDQGRHNAELVLVKVSERASEPEKLANQRAELWWSMRQYIEPLHPTGENDEHGQPVMESLARIVMGTKELAQLNGPMYKVKNGRIQIEEKAEMKKRGIRSPDRAEAILLAYFEPPGAFVPVFGEVPIAEQENPWAYDALTV